MNYPKGHEFEYQHLRPSQMNVDKLYQRDLDPKRVRKIVKEFNGDTFNEPKVSYRDGKYWIFDGAHSTAVWRELNSGKDKPLLCKVYYGMTWLDECNAFIQQNGLDKDPTTNEKLAAAFNAKEPEVVDMVTRAELCGFIVDFKPGKAPARINATSALLRAYKALGPDDYLDMLTAIKEAWYGDRDAVSVQILSGLTTFYKVYSGNFTRKALVEALKRVTPAYIIAHGKQYNNRSNTYTREIVKKYNEKKRYRLDENKL